MKYAPVLIPTISRAEHLERCIKSLSENSWAKYTDLFIGVDYPPNEKYEEGNEKVKRLLEKEILGFKSVSVFFHSVNMGVAGNIKFLRDKSSELHDRFILTEDDNEFSTNFLEYMNRCLEKYERDSSIVAVSGYNYPVKTNNNSEEVFFSNCYFSAYGYGTWNEKYDRMRSEMTNEKYFGMYEDVKMMHKLRKATANQYCNFVKSILRYATPIITDTGVRKIDLTYGLYMFYEGKKMVFPCISKVRNWGFDGSGSNCNELTFDASKPITHRNYMFDCQIIDEKESCEYILELKPFDEKNIIDKINAYFVIENKEMIRTNVSYLLSKIIGKNNTISLIKKITSK